MVLQPAPWLHTSHTNWAMYKTVVHDKVQPAMKLKTHEDIEIATNKFIGILQQAAQVTTPKRHPLSPASNLPSDIKCLVAIKCTARSKWQNTHAPDDRCLFNNASNKLKAALQELRNASFAAYVSSLSREDNSISKQLKSRNITMNTTPPIRKTQYPRDPGPRATQKKSSYSLTI